MSRGQGQRDMSSKASVPVAVYPFGSSPWSLALLICKMGIVAHPSLGCCEVVITAKPSGASHQGALVVFLLLPLENPLLDLRQRSQIQITSGARQGHEGMGLELHL